MELRQLEYFVAVADAGSFTAAAAALHVTQSALSQQVRRLERELGVDLLDRGSHGAALTGAGQTLLGTAHRVLAEAAAARDLAASLSGQLRGRLAIGMIDSMPIDRLPGLLADYHRRYPAVHVTLAEDGCPQLIGAVRAGRLDVAFLGEPPSALPPGMNGRLLQTENFVVALAAGHPLAAQPAIDLAELAGEPFVEFPISWAIRAAVDAACTAAGFGRHVAFEVGQVDLLGALISASLAVAIVPETVAARADPATVATRPLHHSSLCRSLTLAWQLPSPAARAFVDLAGASWPTPISDHHDRL